jgi:hypothetical protein
MAAAAAGSVMGNLLLEMIDYVLTDHRTPEEKRRDEIRGWIWTVVIVAVLVSIPIGLIKGWQVYGERKYQQGVRDAQQGGLNEPVRNPDPSQPVVASPTGR